jgi:mannose-6-phosphate isomerase-like protein (cupin superfamily)
MATTLLSGAESKNFKNSSDTRDFPKGRLDVVTVGGKSIGRAVFQPGWKWSESIKPIAKTTSCEASHLGYVISGSMTVVMDNGTTMHLGPGDAFAIPPGHDAWIDGNEACDLVDFVGFETYAQPG